MGSASKQYCERLVSNYLNEIESQKKMMEKNFKDMDLENASVRDDIEDLVNEMKCYCDQLKTAISDYKFE